MPSWPVDGLRQQEVAEVRKLLEHQKISETGLQFDSTIFDCALKP